MASETDRIERTILLRAPAARVWRAISDPKEHGAWFGVAIESPRFEPGAAASGWITTPGYTHLRWEITVERMEPETLFSYRWHPHAVDPGRDHSGEPTTLVEYALAPHPEGTMLTITESGFDALPEARRATALRTNAGGWSQQTERIARHVAS